uniref:Ig-like domain-containing protein n=1 Tax=Poecilia mexicana TaxID=48701 RepID=A0A3B3WKW5_9TELE
QFSKLFIYFNPSLLISAQTVHQVSSSVQQGSRFVSVKAGESVTVQCFYNPKSTSKINWYKLSFGQKPKPICTAYKYENGTFYNEFKDNPRFTLDTEEHLSNLRIANLQPSDSAIYFCITGHSYKIEFDGGTVIHVQESVLNIQALIDQQSETEIFQPGDSVTLNCTLQTGSCGGEHRVYWFRNSEEHYPGLIYTHGGSNHQCERKPGEQSNTCVFSLPLKNLTVSNAGTYYCAVASCGRILFGNGTNLNVKNSVYLLTGALVFTTFLSVSQAYCFFFLIHKIHINSNFFFSIYNNFPFFLTRRLTDKKSSRSTRQRNETSECVYSSVQM